MFLNVKLNHWNFPLKCVLKKNLLRSSFINKYIFKIKIKTKLIWNKLWIFFCFINGNRMKSSKTLQLYHLYNPHGGKNGVKMKLTALFCLFRTFASSFSCSLAWTASRVLDASRSVCWALGSTWKGTFFRPHFLLGTSTASAGWGCSAWGWASGSSASGWGSSATASGTCFFRLPPPCFIW